MSDNNQDLNQDLNASLQPQAANPAPVGGQPNPAATPASPAVMLFPDGYPRSVKPEVMSDALHDGAKPTQKLFFPDGKARYVPTDMIESAIHDGAKYSFDDSANHPVANAAVSTIVGAGKGLGEGLHTVAAAANQLANKVGVNIPQLPSSFQQPDYLRSESGYETAGKVGEGVLEFVMGDGALKALKLADRMKIASTLQKVVGDEPYIAKIVEAGLNSIRAGVVSGAQTGLHEPTPGAIATGAGFGLAGGALGEGLGAGAEALGTLTPEAKAAAAQAKAIVEAGQRGEELYADTLENAQYVSGIARDSAELHTGKPQLPSINAKSTPDEIRAFVRASNDYTFGDAAKALENEANPIYNKLRQATALPVENGISGGNAFDIATQKIKDAQQVLFKSANKIDIGNARKDIAEGKAELDAIFNDPKNGLSITDLQAARDNWRRKLTMESLDAVMSKAFDTTQAIRSATGALPQTTGPKMIRQINKAIDTISLPELRDALGPDNAKALIDLHTDLTKAVQRGEYEKVVTNLQKAALASSPSPASAQNKTISEVLLGGGVGALVHLLGASNPVTATAGVGVAGIHWAYTHPRLASKILAAAAKGMPITAQLLKQGVTHQYDPQSGTVQELPVSP